MWWKYLDHVFLKHSGKKIPRNGHVHTWTHTLPDWSWLCGLRSVRVSSCQHWSLPLCRMGLVAARTPHMFWELLRHDQLGSFSFINIKHLTFNLDVSKHYSLEYNRPLQANSAWHATEEFPKIERDTDLPPTHTLRSTPTTNIPYLATLKTIELRPHLTCGHEPTAQHIVLMLLSNRWV